MITVPEACKKIVERSPYLSEALVKGLINLSALARTIKPEIEEMLIKDVSEAAIVMALKRLSLQYPSSVRRTYRFTTHPDMLVRSNLVEINIANSETLVKKHQMFIEASGSQSKYFFVLTQGVFETTVIISRELERKIKKILNGEKVVTTFTNLSAITIRLSKRAIEAPGTYYFFLKSLAWEGINIIEVVSAYLELTIIIEDNEVNHAFAILKSLFEK